MKHWRSLLNIKELSRDGLTKWQRLKNFECQIWYFARIRHMKRKVDMTSLIICGKVLIKFLKFWEIMHSSLRL